MFFTIACAVFIATTLQQWCFAVMGAALSKRVRQMLFRSILRQDIGYGQATVWYSAVLVHSHAS